MLNQMISFRLILLRYLLFIVMDEREFNISIWILLSSIFRHLNLKNIHGGNYL